MQVKLAGEQTIYDYTHSDAYPLERILDVADRASDRQVGHLPALIEAMKDSHPIVRYWGATGCVILQEQSAPAKEALRKLLSDEWADVRVAAAEALAHLGQADDAFKTLEDVIKHGNLYEGLAAQNSLDYLRQSGHVSLARAQEIVRGLELAEPADRIPRYLLQLSPETSPAVPRS
jgi:hypothetical protein